MARGSAGTPCACFGGRGRVGALALLRTLALAATDAYVAVLDEPRAGEVGASVLPISLG